MKRTALVHSDEAINKAREERENLEAAARKFLAQQGTFFRHFQPHLTGEQMTACMYLRRMLEIEAGAGNATSNYDGVPAPDSFTGKTYSDRALNAVGFVKRCRRHIVDTVQPFHVSAWKAMERALNADLAPQELGDLYRIWTGQGRNRDERRAIAIEVIYAAADAVVFVYRADNAKFSRPS